MKGCAFSKFLDNSYSHKSYTFWEMKNIRDIYIDHNRYSKMISKMVLYQYKRFRHIRQSFNDIKVQNTTWINHHDDMFMRHMSDKDNIQLLSDILYFYCTRPIHVECFKSLVMSLDDYKYRYFNMDREYTERG